MILLIAIGTFLYVRDAISPKSLTEGGQEKLEKPQLNRQEIMQDVTEKIDDISPAKPVLGGSWYVNRFWFVKDKNEDFYVEYEDGYILQRVLLNAEKKGDEIEYIMVGYFESGETNWILKKGDDPHLDKGLDLYEYDKETGRWVKL